jgi:hypothetical protein
MRGVYDPELVALMSAALEAAWERFLPRPKDGDLARLLMASAILEKVDSGVHAEGALIESASRALLAAVSSPLLQTALHRMPQKALKPANSKGPDKYSAVLTLSFDESAGGRTAGFRPGLTT